MTEEQQPREERRERKRRPIWRRSLIGALLFLLVLQTAYILYMHYGAAMAIGRASQSVMDSPGLADLRELTADIELNTPPGEQSFSEEDREEIDQAAKELGGLLGGGESTEGIQQILGMATQLRTLYDDALNMAEDPLGTHGIDRMYRRHAMGGEPVTGPVQLETGEESRDAGSSQQGVLIIAQTPGAIKATLEPHGSLEEVNVSLEGPALVVTTKSGPAGRESTIRKRLPAEVDPATLETRIEDGRIVIEIDKKQAATPSTPSAQPQPAAHPTQATA